MREWDAEPEPSARGLDDLFARLFPHEPSPARSPAPAADRAAEPGRGEHPPEEVLRAYGAGGLVPDWPGPEEIQGIWGYRRISVHVLRCGRCRARLRALQSARTPALRKRGLRWLRRWLQEAAQPVPRPALATIAVQSLVILGLVGLLLWQPEPIFRSAPRVDASGARSLPASPPETETGLPVSPPAPGPAGEPLAEAGEVSYPPEVLQAIRTVQTVPDPAQRLNALRLLQHYPDPLLVEDLSRLYERETHPQVREEMARTIWVILSRTDRGLSGAVRFFEKLRRQAPDRTWYQKLQQEFAEMQKRLAEGLQIRIEVHPAQSLRCAARRDLTLEDLARIASDLDGTIVLDRSTPRRLQVHLPASASRAEALQRLEGFGLVCRE